MGANFRWTRTGGRNASEGFESLDTARRWLKDFVHWYNHEPRHSRIKFVTPEQRHTGEHIEMLKKRQALYAKMKQCHPERWSTTTRNWQHEAIVELNPKHHEERKAA